MKRSLALTLVWSLLISLLVPFASAQAETAFPNMPVIANQEGNHQRYFLVPEHFQTDLGTWLIQTNDGTLRGRTLIGRTDRNVNATRPANAAIEIASTDVYYVWARTRDFNTFTGQRQFKMSFNGYTLPHAFGAHGVHGWKWERGGRVKLNAGTATVALQDTSAYFPRVDGIVLTTDPHFVPDANYTTLKAQLEAQQPKTPLSPYENVPYMYNLSGYFAGYFVVPEQFGAAPGTWTVESSPEALRGVLLQGKDDGQPSTAVPATASIAVDVPGIYTTWVYTQDNDAGFALKVEDQQLPEALGDNGTGGWAWERAGRVNLKAGSASLELRDTSGRGPRMAALLFTADPEFVPSADYAELKWDLALTRPLSEGPPPSDVVFLRSGSFEEFGTWNLQGYESAFGTVNLIGIMSPDDTVFDPSAAEPAVARFEAPISGTYKIWVRSRDFSARQGTRFFNVEVNGQRLAKTFGKHGINGWAWEDGGTVELAPGENVLKLHDTSGFYARTDGIFLTNDLNFRPPNTYAEMLEIAKPTYVFQDRLDYPAWAKTSAEPTQVHTLENDDVRIEFSEVPTAQGNVVQKRTYLKHNGSFVPVESRTDEFGYLMLYGEQSAPVGVAQQSPIFSTQLTEGGQDIRLVTVNAFEAGLPHWMIPSSISLLGEDAAVLTAENELARLEAEWSLPDGAAEPVVTVRLFPKQAGAFSVGMFNGTERGVEDIDYLLNPFRYHGKRLPEEPVLNTEQTSSNAASSVTLSGKPEIAGGLEVTYAVAADPSSIESRWAYDDNAAFGLGIMGRGRGVQPSLFAPLLGMPRSQMEPGDAFTFTYRPVTRLAGWYDTYRHVAQNVMGLTDYRKNIESSLTDTIFNVQDLMLDDNYGGWDTDMKAHYNMEGQNVGTTASPLAAIQAYMLTEDEDLYERRVLPTLASMLTRKNQHFSSKGNTIAHPAITFPNPLPIGSATAGYGTSVFGGLFEMTQGLSPAFREVGVDNGVRQTSGNAPSWSDHVWMYRYTGNTAYLDQAKAAADQYLQTVVYAAPKTLPDYSSFIYISYYPNLNALLDLYEISGEQRYLDGAAAAARVLMTTLRTFPVPEGDIAIDADAIRERGFLDGAHFWWKGEVSDRLGHPERLADLQDMTVPAWMPSPVGLGVEQASTFMGTDSGFITMSNWAPDLMRLAEMTGDDTFEMYARNAVLGRGANYPGYYQNQYMMHQKTADFPYVGPDLTSIYYHHIPVYYGLLTDYLLAQAWNWSDGRIGFPFLRQQGYAYFNNRKFGSEPGTFFGETDMWPWLKRGLVTTDNIQIDWLAARKDGKLGVALMNEDASDIATTVSFGEELGGALLEGSATLYDAAGNASAVTVSGGAVTVTVPARGLIALVMDHPDVKAPGFAGIDESTALTRPIGQTVVHAAGGTNFGAGAVLQTNPAFYHAYAYVTDMPETTARATLHYRIGEGEWQTAEKATYPYEFTVKVTGDAPFDFYFDVHGKDGTVRTSSAKRLKPYASGTDVTGFEAGGQIGAFIAPERQTVVSVVYGADVTNLSPVVSVSEGATLLTPTGPADYTAPVEYVIRAENGVTATWTVFAASIDDADDLARLVAFLSEQGWIGSDGNANSLSKQALHEQYRAFKNHVDSLAAEGRIPPEAASLLHQAADVLIGEP